MPIIELNIPEANRVPFDKLHPEVQTLLQDSRPSLRDGVPVELIMGHAIHMLALTDGFNHAGPNNQDILPKVTRPLPNGYAELAGLRMRQIHGLMRENEPIEATLIYRLPECSSLLFDRAVNDIVGFANKKLREIGIPLIPER